MDVATFNRVVFELPEAGKLTQPLRTKAGGACTGSAL
jgi:hypothetical protein